MKKEIYFIRVFHKKIEFQNKYSLIYIPNVFTVADINEVLLDFYKILKEYQYPKLEKVNVNNIKSSVLFANNRTHLLSWILNQCPNFDNSIIKTLNDVALQDALFEQYSQLGICLNEDILLNDMEGNMSKKQLEMIKNLTYFMKTMCISCSTNANMCKVKEKDVEKIKWFNESVKNYVESKLVLSTFSKDSKVNYTEAKKYIQNIKNEIEQCDLTSLESPETCPNEISVLPKRNISDADRNVDEEITAEKLIKSFDSIESWPDSKNSNLFLNVSKNFCSDIHSMCEDYSTLNKMLKDKDEILNSSVTQKIKKIETLDQIVEDNVVLSSKICNVYNNLKEHYNVKIDN